AATGVPRGGPGHGRGQLRPARLRRGPGLARLRAVLRPGAVPPRAAEAGGVASDGAVGPAALRADEPLALPAVPAGRAGGRAGFRRAVGRAGAVVGGVAAAPARAAAGAAGPGRRPRPPAVPRPDPPPDRGRRLAAADGRPAADERLVEPGLRLG